MVYLHVNLIQLPIAFIEIAFLEEHEAAGRVRVKGFLRVKETGLG